MLRAIRRALSAIFANKVDAPMPTRDITPEEAINNLKLILDQPNLFLRVKRGKLSVDDMADIADYIRDVQCRRGGEE